MSSAARQSARCTWTTPFGSAVVPEVKKTVAGSSGETVAARREPGAPSGARSTAPPSAGGASHTTSPSAGSRGKLSSSPAT